MHVFSFLNINTLDLHNLFHYSDITSAKPNMQQRTESSLKFSATTIAAAIAGSVTLLAVIIIIACILKRRERKPLKPSKDIKSVTFTAMSMRDRIRALDENKVLSLFNPDDIKQLPLTSIEYLRDLGSGNFGLVFLGMYVSHNSKQFEDIIDHRSYTQKYHVRPAGSCVQLIVGSVGRALHRHHRSHVFESRPG